MQFRKGKIKRGRETASMMNDATPATNTRPLPARENTPLTFFRYRCIQPFAQAFEFYAFNCLAVFLFIYIFRI